MKKVFIQPGGRTGEYLQMEITNKTLFLRCCSFEIITLSDHFSYQVKCLFTEKPLLETHNVVFILSY